MQSEIESLKKLCNPKSKVSCHYFIGFSGKITRLVPDEFSAWHAGKSNWKNINLLNKWFAISSILFLFSFMWMFYHDNDDQFKIYQREFRKIEAQVASEKLQAALEIAMDKIETIVQSYNSVCV